MNRYTTEDNKRLAMRIDTPSLFLSALFFLLFGITASASCTWIHHRGAILPNLRVGTFLEEEEEEVASSTLADSLLHLLTTLSKKWSHRSFFDRF